MLPIQCFWVASLVLLSCISCSPATENEGNTADQDETTAVIQVHVNQAIDIASDNTVPSSSANNSTDENSEEESEENAESEEVVQPVPVSGAFLSKNKALNLNLVNQTKEIDCVINGDTLTSKLTLSATKASQVPTDQPEFNSNISHSIVYDTTYSSEEGKGLACSSDKNPLIILPAVEVINISRKIQENRATSLKRITDEVETYRSQIKKNGLIRMLLEKVKNAENEEIIQNTSYFTIEVEYDFYTEQEGDRSFSSKIETQENAPLVSIKEVTPSKRLQSRILSGTISSKDEQNQVIETNFKDLLIDLNKNCIPIGGEVNGTIYASEAKETVVSSYKLRFEENKTLVEYPNGDLKEVLTAGCGIF